MPRRSLCFGERDAVSLPWDSTPEDAYHHEAVARELWECLILNRVEIMMIKTGNKSGVFWEWYRGEDVGLWSLQEPAGKKMKFK